VTVHDLKCWPGFFRAIEEGRKNHEVRRNDRNFRVGDALRLMEYEPPAAEGHAPGYSGREIYGRVTYLVDLAEIGVPGFVSMEFKRI